MAPAPIDHDNDDRHCAFCRKRYLDTPPERVRAVRRTDPQRGVPDETEWFRLSGVLAPDVFDTVAEFRVVPNLYQILDYFWRVNHGSEVPREARRHEVRYLASEAGRAHVRSILRARALAAGLTVEEWNGMPPEEQLLSSRGLFGSCHDLVIARRHFVDGASTTEELAGSGTLTPDEHEVYTAMTSDAAAALYEGNGYAEYISIYQNWLAPAGASFGHLHKQLAAIDTWSPGMVADFARVRPHPTIYNEFGVRYAAKHGLIVAKNDAAVAFAGIGHRYPSLEVHARSGGQPWELADDEPRGFSGLLHACHVATGPRVASSEEWHHRPRDSTSPCHCGPSSSGGCRRPPASGAARECPGRDLHHGADSGRPSAVGRCSVRILRTIVAGRGTVDP